MTTRGKSKSRPPRPGTFDDLHRLSRTAEAALFIFLMIVLLTLVGYGLSA